VIYERKQVLEIHSRFTMPLFLACLSVCRLVFLLRLLPGIADTINEALGS